MRSSWIVVVLAVVGLGLAWWSVAFGGRPREERRVESDSGATSREGPASALERANVLAASEVGTRLPSRAEPDDDRPRIRGVVQPVGGWPTKVQVELIVQSFGRRNAIPTTVRVALAPHGEFDVAVEHGTRYVLLGLESDILYLPEEVSARPGEEVVLAPQVLAAIHGRVELAYAQGSVELSAVSLTVTVVGERESGRVSANRDGTFGIGLLQPGVEIELEIKSPWAADRTETIAPLAPGERRELDFTLLSGLSVSGRVVDLNGAPLEAVEVVARSPGETFGVPAMTGRAGQFRLSKMTREDGGRHWELFAQVEGRSGPVVLVDALGGEVEGLVLTLDPGPRLVGTVRSSGGEPVHSFFMSVESGGKRRSGNFRTNRFVWYGLPATLCVLEVEGWRLDSEESARVENVLPDSAPLEIVLGPAPIYDVAITVQDENGNAIEDFDVSATKSEDRDGETYRHGLAGLTAGEWNVNVSARGYVSGSQTIVVPEMKDVRFVLGQAAWIRGTVLDGRDQPVFMADVWAKGSVSGRSISGSSEMTDEQGTFELSVTPGTITLQVRRVDDEAWTEGTELVLSAGEAREGLVLRLP